MIAAFEPVIAIAASPRDWAPRLRRHVADRGGARVRATVLHQEDALNEWFEVFVVDDTTSFLTQELVAALHDQGRQILGVYEDLEGRKLLVELGIDQAIERTASTEKLLAAVSNLATNAAPRPLSVGWSVTAKPVRFARFTRAVSLLATRVFCNQGVADEKKP